MNQEEKLQRTLEGRRTCCGCSDPEGHYRECPQVLGIRYHYAMNCVTNEYGISIGYNVDTGGRVTGSVYLDGLR
jgi:hypothetical protein